MEKTVLEITILVQQCKILAIKQWIRKLTVKQLTDDPLDGTLKQTRLDARNRMEDVLMHERMLLIVLKDVDV